MKAQILPRLFELLLFIALSGCASGGLPAPTDPAGSSIVAADRDIKDERPRFRQLFCEAVRRDRISAAADCSDWLHRLHDEPEAPAVGSRNLQRRITDVVIVPGIFGECLKDSIAIFGDATENLRSLGYRITVAPVRGRASSEHNAEIVRSHILALTGAGNSRSVLVLAYSKGAPDTLVAINKYPELHSHVVGLISFAGVIKGTPIADSGNDLYLSTVGQLPYPPCPIVDGGEVKSLTRAERTAWLALHKLPESVKYFSIAAIPASGRVSAILEPLYIALSGVDRWNDSQVIHYDSIIPGSFLLGYVNADHWAIALPFENEAPLIAATFVNRNRFPRKQLVEAAVRLAEELLSPIDGR